MLRSKRGFTLIEVLLVVLIIGILVSILAVRASGISVEAKKKAAMADLKTLKTAVETYCINHDAFPTADSWDTLLTDETNRIVDEVASDPFGTAYTYKTDGIGGGARYVIYSKGPSRIETGTAMGVSSATDAVTGATDSGEDNIWVSNCRTNNNGGI